MVQVEPTSLTGELASGTNGDYYRGTLKGEKTGAVLSVTVNQEKSRWYPGGTTPLFDMGEYVEISASDTQGRYPHQRKHRILSHSQQSQKERTTSPKSHLQKQI